MIKLSTFLLLLLSLTSHAEDYSIEKSFKDYDKVVILSGEIFMDFADDDSKDERDYEINDNLGLSDHQRRKYNHLSVADRIHIQRVTDTLLYDYSNAGDKELHFNAGYIVGSISSELCSPIYKKQTNKSRQLRFWCSFGAATVAGLAKELYDSTGRGNVEAADAVVTSFGGLQLEFRF